MTPFSQHRGICIPIIIDNIDTDQIIPSREMNRISKEGLGDGLFAGWRFVFDGPKKVSLVDDFVLNQDQYSGATILLSGKNFGCGSSREHAVWALREYGIKIIIAESFGRIFRINCARNGLLAIDLPAAQVDLLSAQTAGAPQANRVHVDLARNEIRAPDGKVFSFEIAASDRNMLLCGLDYIDYTLQFVQDIDDFVMQDRAERPWAHL